MIHFFWFPWKPGELNVERYQYSNREIVKGAMARFGERMRLHHMNAVEPVDAAADDLLLGHPHFPFAESTTSWVEANVGARRYLMSPWIDNRLHDRFVAQVEQAGLLFAMCGAIWFDRSMRRGPDDPLAGVCRKLVRINMGCEAGLLAHRHDLGGRNRGFLHMSDLRRAKNPEMLYGLFEGLKDVQLYIGSAVKPDSTLPGLVHLGHLDNADPQTDRLILSQCGFYVHTSITDAQSTTILENCARGLVPILTPESGFRSEFALYLKRADDAHNRAIMLQATQMPEDEYTRRSEGVRRQIADHHGWDGIYRRIEDCIAAHERGEDFDRRGGDLS